MKESNHHLPLEAAPDEEIEPRREIVALKERAAVDFAQRKIFNLCNLFNEAIAPHDSARDTKLFDSRYRHFLTRIIDLPVAPMRSHTPYAKGAESARKGNQP